MDRLYRKTFEQVRMPRERAEKIRSELASRCSQMEKEAIPVRQNKRMYRPVLAVALVVLVCALSATALAYSGGLGRIYTMMTGGNSWEILDADGQVAGVAGSVELDQVADPVEVREDGRLYLVINGEEQDITDQCSYETPYIYECTGGDGLRHAFIIGGDLDAIGWAEFFWNEEGMPQGGAAHFGTSEGPSDAPWLEVGKEELNLPW